MNIWSLKEDTFDRNGLNWWTSNYYDDLDSRYELDPVGATAFASTRWPPDILPPNLTMVSSKASQARRSSSGRRNAVSASELDGPLLLLISNAGSFMTGVSSRVDSRHLVSGL